MAHILVFVYGDEEEGTGTNPVILPLSNMHEPHSCIKSKGPDWREYKLDVNWRRVKIVISFGGPVLDWRVHKPVGMLM